MVAQATKYEWAAWALMATALVFTLWAKLLPALLAGLLVYELVVLLSPRFVSNRLSHSRAKMVVVALISAAVLSVLIGAVVGAIAYYKAEGGSYAALLKNMAEVIENSRNLMPPWVAEYLPQGDESQIRATLSDWLRDHAQEIKTFGGSAGHALAMVVIGLIIGSFVALNEGRQNNTLGLLAQAMTTRAYHLGPVLPQSGVRASAHFAAQYDAHRLVPCRGAAGHGRGSALCQNHDRDYVCRGAAAGAG